MLDPGNEKELPPIPAKRYFTIGEVSELCGVKPHVLRDCRRRNELQGARVGNKILYSRADLLEFLSRRK